MNLRKTVLAVLAGSTLIFGFYLPFVHYTAVNEVGIMFNRMDGEVRADTPGLHLSAPWVFVAKVDTRPQRACITSVAKTMTCKLARFVPTHYAEFVKREGFRYYWWDNRISFNLGYFEEYRGVRDVIRGYAFSGAKQKFVEVMEDIHE